MQRFTNILAVYGDGPGSDDVLVQAACLARGSGARLTIVDVSETPRSHRMVEEARRRLARLAPWFAQEGVGDVTTDVLVGAPHGEIVRRVEDDAHDLVIVSGETGASLRDMLFGRLATSLLLKCPCAVWVLKPGQAVPCESVAAAVNLAGADNGETGLDARILGHAASLAQSLDAHLHLVHFWDVEARDGEMLRSEIRDTTRTEILERHETARRAALDDLLRRHAASAPVHAVHLPRGRPQLRMADFTDDLSVDLLVMGAECRRGVARLLLGNFTETVLAGVRCSVLAVKPEDCRPAIAPALAASPYANARAALR